MLIPFAADYAIRAMIQMAEHPNELRLARVIAKTEGIPQHYLGNVLQTLAHRGLLRSFPGPTGGFMLARPASQIYVAEVVAEFCVELLFPLFFPADLKRRVNDWFSLTSIADLASPVPVKRKARAAEVQQGAEK